MIRIRIGFVLALLVAMFTSCGVDGDPGHCYFSLDWEWYSEDYGVYYYEDNNPDVPQSADIEPQLYYDCYPGEYEFFYKAEDPRSWYEYEGFYILYQNPGFRGGLFRDGPDGVDTYFDLYLLIYPEEEDLRIAGSIHMEEAPMESLAAPLLSFSDRPVMMDPDSTEEFNFIRTKGDWTLEFSGVCRIYEK